MQPLAVAELIGAVFVGISLIGQFNKEDRSRSIKWLRLALILMFFYLLIDASAYTFTGPEHPLAMRYVINLLAYSLGSVVIIFFTKYCEAYIGEKKPVGKWVFLIPTILLVLCTAGAAAEFIAGKLIVYENGVAVTVNAFPTSLRVAEVAAMLYVLAVAVVRRKDIGMKAVLLLGLYNVAPIISSAVAVAAGVDLSVLFGAFSLVLVASLLQRDVYRESLEKMNQSLDLANQQRHVKAFGDMVNAALWNMDIDDKDEVIEVNWSSELRHMFGFAESEKEFPNVLGSWTDRLHPEDRERTLAHFREGLQCRDTDIFVYDAEYRLLRKNFEYCWYHSVGRMENLDNGLRRFYGITFDISAEKLLEEKHRQLQEALEAANREQRRTDVLHDIIHSGKWTVYVNANDEIVGGDVSDAASRIIRNDIPEDGSSWLDIVHPEDREATEAAFFAAIRDHSGNTPYDVNFRMKDRNGEYHRFHAAGRIIRDAAGNGEFFGIHVAVDDGQEQP